MRAFNPIPRDISAAPSIARYSLTACEAITLSVPRGEVYALLGRNGAGKSSLIKCLSGATIPDEGQLILDGKAYIQVDYRHIEGHGAIGVWTKADSVTAFDDFSWGC